MRVLNLCAGIGGNRKLWTDCKVTAVELIPAIAEVYQQINSNDEVVIGDANKYLEDNYQNFDFIWSSPPCQSHGQYRHNVGVLGKGFKPIMPDMSLYSQIVFLQTYFKGKFCIENTVPYYGPLVKPTAILQRHLFWANFEIPFKLFEKDAIRTKNKISDFEGWEIVANSKIENKRQVLRNCVLPELGKYIFDCANINPREENER
ncbi:DNA (cytosine-5)-methyltransferase 1 [Elusimicrobium simillimum]|uniref:DNA cytosine methyltransferase n=1 Tax=Elusimicrobium simillimum TaxID=3143438 RepID=UPI003C6F9E12